jgi:long-chain acyl-CoA synthetase
MLHAKLHLWYHRLPKGSQAHSPDDDVALAGINISTAEFALSSADTYISYLPYAHIFEQILYAEALVEGMRIGYYSGDILKIVSEDLPVLQPTFFPAVPRLFNRMYGLMQDKLKAASGGCKGWLVGQAFETKLANLERDGTVTHGCYDSLVMKKVAAALGGKVNKMLTGSAPLSKEVMNFFKVAFSSQFIEGYGMTETTGATIGTQPHDNLTGHVGGPQANVKVRLRDLPDRKYLHTDSPARGEICFFGGSIMKGYFKNDEKTAECLTKDGWLMSGDIGVIYENGQIRIIDRVKNIFKLSQGEYISPEKVESIMV